MRWLIPVVLLFAIVISGCLEDDPANCDDMEEGILFGRDSCWTPKAEKAQDVNICLTKVGNKYANARVACVGRVASATEGSPNGGSILCDNNYPVKMVEKGTKTKPRKVDMNKKSREYCLRIYNQRALGPKMEACKEMGGDKTEVCLHALASESVDVKPCKIAKAKDLCILGMSVENQDPVYIKVNIRQDTEQYLAYYAIMALDSRGWKDIKDNRLHDTVVIMTMSIAYGRLDKVPVDDYCDMMRGNYEYDGDTPPEEEFRSQKNFCNSVSAGLVELRDGGDRCNTWLPPRIDEIYDYTKEDNVERCNEFVSQHRALKARIAAADNEELLKIMKELE